MPDMSDNVRKKHPMGTPALPTAATYFPMESSATPADNCDDNWAAKATMPSGSVHISQRMSRKSSYCNPSNRFITAVFGCDSSSRASPSPTAAATTVVSSV